MSATDPSTPMRSILLLLNVHRILLALATSTVMGLILSPAFTTTPAVQVIGREMVVGIAALLAFGVAEQWPRTLPTWLARWALQVVCVAAVVPFAVLGVYLFITYGQPIAFWHSKERVSGFFMMTFTGMLLAPWMAVSALVRQREFQVHSQALGFELERSEFERQALDARMRLLQAQVEPHFLFNTLANVRELVDSGSAQASDVLGSLIAYLRAAVPRLHESTATLGQEMDLVRSYLELMHLRMPDRLQFFLDADDEARSVDCPPMTILTLVENAVRHGIDPSEEGGRIEVRVRVHGGRCRVEVLDTGVGLAHGEGGLGTGLSNLRERLRLAFAGEAQLRLNSIEPHGVRAEAEFPARRVGS